MCTYFALLVSGSGGDPVRMSSVEEVVVRLIVLYFRTSIGLRISTD
jgi:hypothetical protein